MNPSVLCTAGKRFVMEVRLQSSRQSEPMSHLVAFTGAGPLGHPKIFINLVCAIILFAP